MNSELIEKLAEAAHDIWVEGKVRDGWTFAPVTNKEAKQHACIVPYDQLSEADKQSDRDFVIGIPKILKRAGMMAVPDPFGAKQLV